MKLGILYLTSDSRHYTFPHFIDLLSKSERKSEWCILIMTHSNDQDFYVSNVSGKGINYVIMNVNPHNNYMTKVHESINWCEKYNIPYMMKCDNDIFL